MRRNIGKILKKRKVEGQRTMHEMPQIALVSGASRGIGFEITRQLAAKGITVLLTARTQDQAVKATQELEAAGYSAIAQQLDVTNDESVENLAQVVENEFGRLDILVNNAGILIDGSQRPSTADLSLVQKTLETNVLGAWRLCKAFLPLMKRSDYGRIVNVSASLGSIEELAGREGTWPAYCFSKAALNALTVLFAAELRGTNILVNAACPGWVQTAMGGSYAPTPVHGGADTPVWLATLPNGSSTGTFFRQRKPISW